MSIPKNGRCVQTNRTGLVFSLALLGEEVNQATIGVWEKLKRLSGWFESPLSDVLAATTALHIVVRGLGLATMAGLVVDCCRPLSIKFGKDALAIGR